MNPLKMYKLVSGDEEDQLVEITACRLPSYVLPQWQERYDGFYIELVLAPEGLTAALSDATVAEREIDPDDVATICADALELIANSETPEALPTIADRYTRLLGATVKLESLVYLSLNPENVKGYLENPE
jgi:hypothetical protein